MQDSLMSHETRGLAGPGMRKWATVALYVCLVAEYVALLLEIGEMSRVHSLSPVVWMLPVVYPVPWILALAFRKQIRTAFTQGSMNQKAVNLCNDWITLLTIISYVAIFTFTELHAGQ